MNKSLVYKLDLKKHDINILSFLYHITWRIITSLFVVPFIIIFPGSVSYFNPDLVSIILLHDMGRVRIIIIFKKESWRIRRGGQITNIVFRGNRNGSWKKIWVIQSFFIRAVSIIYVNGMWIQSWATKFSCK